MARRGPSTAHRLHALLATLALSFAMVVGRLVYLQVVEASSFERLAAKQRVRSLDLPARRGPIYDRSMRPLVLSLEAKTLYANPRFISDPDAAARDIAPILGEDPAAVVGRLRRDSGFVYLARKVDPEVASRVLALGLPGVGALDDTRRVYPEGTLASQVLGFVGTDDDGLAGIERQSDATLRGSPGREVVEQDPRGRPIPQGRHSIRRPVAGRGVVLTIDRDLQFAAESALGRAVPATGSHAGVAVVMDPRSGDVLAMANWPPFDPSTARTAEPADWRNRAVMDSYEPGSVNKVITAAAGIESGLVGPADRFVVPDHLKVANKVFHDFHPHPTETLTFSEIIARSSNIGTIEVALKLGARRVNDMLLRFGYGRPTGLEFPGEGAGILLPLRDWYPTSIGTIPIGHGVSVTPLQMAAVYATVANDGVWTRPRLVAGTVGGDGTVTPAPAPERRTVVTPRTAALLRAMLIGVVDEGTGKAADLPEYLVGGKTGTARVPLEGRRGYSNKIITTFVGMIPAEAPRLIVLVALDNPTKGRTAATTTAPAFRDIAQQAIARLRIPPTFPAADGSRALAARRTWRP